MSTSGDADPRRERLRDAADLAHSRQEDENRAALLAERGERHARDFVFDPRGCVSSDIARLDRMGAALGLDERRFAQQRAHARAVERRRHDEDAQILAQRPLRVERQRQAEVGVERALVELVEQNPRYAVERGIVEDLTCEHALGDDLDAGAFGDEALQPHA